MKTMSTHKEASFWLNSQSRLIKLLKTARTWSEFLTSLMMLKKRISRLIKISRSQRCSLQQIMANLNKSIELRRHMSRMCSCADFNRSTRLLQIPAGSADISKPPRHLTVVRKEMQAGTTSTNTGEPTRYQQQQLRLMDYIAVGETTRPSCQVLIERWITQTWTQADFPPPWLSSQVSTTETDPETLPFQTNREATRPTWPPLISWLTEKRMIV